MCIRPVTIISLIISHKIVVVINSSDWGRERSTWYLYCLQRTHGLACVSAQICWRSSMFVQTIWERRSKEVNSKVSDVLALNVTSRTLQKVHFFRPFQYQRLACWVCFSAADKLKKKNPFFFLRYCDRFWHFIQIVSSHANCRHWR